MYDHTTQVNLTMFDRYVACIPQYCGFNDVMCQIWRTYEYACSCNRVLVVDTRASCLADDISYYMNYAGSQDNVIMHMSDELIDFFNTQECYPKKFQYQIEQLLQPLIVDSSTNLSSKDDFEPLSPFRKKLEKIWYASIPYRGMNRMRNYLKDYQFYRRSEPLVIHDAFGGGTVSALAIQLFRLNSTIQSNIKQQLTVLGDDYDAIHIRHTDYQTDYEPFLRQLSTQLSGRRVLVCSDNPHVKKRASEILTNSKVQCIPQPFDTPDTGQFGLPVHYQWHLTLQERRQRNIGLLTDLIGLAKSRKLYFTEVRKGDGFGYSGFSRLASELQSRPDILKAWAGI